MPPRAAQTSTTTTSPSVRRRASTALASARAELDKYKASTRKKMAQLREAQIPNALMHAGTMWGGAAASGVVRGLVGDTVAGIPVDITGALVLGGVSGFAGWPYGVSFAAGLGAPYVADFFKGQTVKLTASMWGPAQQPVNAPYSMAA